MVMVWMDFYGFLIPALLMVMVTVLDGFLLIFDPCIADDDDFSVDFYRFFECILVELEVRKTSERTRQLEMMMWC